MLFPFYKAPVSLEMKNGLGWDGKDLTQITVMIGTSVCPSPEGEGMVLNPFLCDGVVEFPGQCLV